MVDHAKPDPKFELIGSDGLFSGLRHLRYGTGHDDRIPFTLSDGAFDPAVISILEDAFEDAWRRVQASSTPYGTDEYAAAGCAILARHIIQAAKAGERDPRWLADSALLYLARQRLSRTPPNSIA
jgi:hypothetical protein